MKALERRTKTPARASEQQFIVGPRSAVEQQIARLSAAGRLDAKAPGRVSGRNEVTVPVWVFPAAEIVAKPRIHPGWIVGGMATGAALVAAAAWFVFAVVSVVVAYGVVILVVLAIGGAAKVILGGDSFTQIMNIRR